MDTVKRSRASYCDIDCQWRSAHSRGGTSVRSWLESVRNHAITWGNACDPIGSLAFRRPRILLWVGQRWKATIDPRWEGYDLQDGQLLVSCRSRVVPQFWKRFVFYIAITGLVEKRVRNSSWRQDATRFMFIFRFSIRPKWRTGSRKLVRITPKPKTKRKRGMAVEIRMTVCEIFLNGWRSSQVI